MGWPKPRSRQWIRWSSLSRKEVISKAKEVAMGTKYRFSGKWKLGGCHQSSRFWRCFHPFAEFKMGTTEAGIYDWLLSAWQQGGTEVSWLQSWTKVFRGYLIVTGILDNEDKGMISTLDRKNCGKSRLWRDWVKTPGCHTVRDNRYKFDISGVTSLTCKMWLMMSFSKGDRK